MNIGLLSDTHGYCHAKILDFLSNCDEIWHCGDIGSMAVLEMLTPLAPLRAVHGNIDYGEMKKAYPEFQYFHAAGLSVLMTHIGGYPGKYSPQALKQIVEHRPALFVCGHSHILKVMYDQKYQMLCMNPGAAGKQGIHHLLTAMRFKIINARVENLELIEVDR